MRRILLLTMVLAGGCLLGCKSFNAKSADDQAKVLKMWTEFARENNVEMIAQVDARGRGGLYFEQLYGIDLGVGAHGVFVFRPTNAAPAPKTTPP